ncbi:hypothetical protein ILYODFUR_012186 [Ilyodon furcidens]|uniref:Uncharacterized protein n=1 Tax=Ilyodon furcidens TaxID=33524 RepID=A0ABV0SWC2_9TELE
MTAWLAELHSEETEFKVPICLGHNIQQYYSVTWRTGTLDTGWWSHFLEDWERSVGPTAACWREGSNPSRSFDPGGADPSPCGEPSNASLPGVI